MRIVLTTPVKVPAGWTVEAPDDMARALIARGAAEAAADPAPAGADEKPTVKSTGGKSAGA